MTGGDLPMAEAPARSSPAALTLARASLRLGTMDTNVRSEITNAAELLPEHHRVLDDRLDRIVMGAKVRDAADLRDDWSDFERELLRHLEYEEAELLPGFATDSPAEARAILAEHANIRATLADLGMSLDLHLLRSQAVEAFVQQLKAHARREDEMLYAWARRRGAADDRQGRRHRPSMFDGRIM
jgi:hemerythrin-like domain-containing protein